MKSYSILAFILTFSVACSLDAPEPLPDQSKPESPASSAEQQTLPAPENSPSVQVQEEVVTDANLIPPETKHLLVEKNELDKIKDDLSKGLTDDYLKVDALGRLPIHYATSYEAVKLLADLEVNVGRKQVGRRTVPLKQKSLFVVDGAGMTPYHVMAANGLNEPLAYVLDRLCQWWYRDELNLKTPEGRNILHLAVLSRDKATVDQTLQCRFLDQSAVDASGKSALHFAVEEDGFAIGWFLLNYSVAGTYRFQIYLKDKAGLTPLDYAKQRHNKVAEQLLKPKAPKPQSAFSPWYN